MKKELFYGGDHVANVDDKFFIDPTTEKYWLNAAGEKCKTKDQPVIGECFICADETELVCVMRYDLDGKYSSYWVCPKCKKKHA